MDHRRPLRDLTSLNIPDFEITDMEKSNENNRNFLEKPRFSVIKAFDPLYNSPGPIVDISGDSNDSIFQSINNSSFNDENINPRCSNLINVSDISEDISINDLRILTEDIINEALDHIFAKEKLKENLLSLTETDIIEVKTESITEPEETKEFITIPELLEIKHECDNHDMIVQLELLVQEKEDDLVSLRNELFEIKPECESLKQEVKELKEEIIVKDNKLENYVKTVEQLEKCLKGKDDDLAKLQEEVSEIKSLYEEMKMREVKYKDAKNTAEGEEKTKIQELQDLVSKKDVEINILNQTILNSEQDQELKIKEYEDILESQAELLKRATAELETLKEENQWAKRHLSNQEVAFGDVYDKYERCKRIIEGYKINEETLKSNCQMFENTLSKYEELRKAMKLDADAKYKKWSEDMEKLREDNRAETSILLKKIKHWEIKNSSLSSALEQKNKECQELTELCQEITEKS